MQKSLANAVGNEFYQKVGSLFYAIAVADKYVHPKEVEELKSIVKSLWLPLDDLKDEFGSDAAYQIEIVFDWLLANEKSGSECFEEFKLFYKNNPEIFASRIKEIILLTADSIANSFARKNKAELIVLGNLKLLFET